MFYVYEWYNIDTEEIFYVGKGCGNRYKQTRKRNALFQQYYENNNCDVRIIRYFEDEITALEYEYKHIQELKTQGQCQCNIDEGGHGGLSFVWTEEMKQYKSQFNPMKDEKQRQRMSEYNPMKKPMIAQKVAKKKSKTVCYLGEEYTARELADKVHCDIETIRRWCKRGYDTEGRKCHYKGENPSGEKHTTCSKGVLIDEIYFPSLRAAADYLGVKDTSPLCKALKSNRTYKGHKCKYANQQPSGEKSDNSISEGSTTNE